MSEKKKLLTLIVLALILGAVAVLISMAVPFLLEGDLFITRYQAQLQPDGTFTERYAYEVRADREYRMLFRYWEEPTTTGELASPHIRFEDMEVPPGTIGYFKDYSGRVTLKEGDNPAHVNFIQQNAEYNEAGIYNPDYFSAGTYTVTYSWVLHPPVEYDDHDAHLNLRLADEHVPYRDMEIRIPAVLAGTVFPHPPALGVRKEGDSVVVTGSVAGDEVLGVETLFSPGNIGLLESFPAREEGVRQKTLEANPFYNILPLYLAEGLYGLGFFMVIFTPVLFLIIYHRFGREKEFTVPEYLSFTPDPEMKPWAVNLLFKGDAVDFDNDGYYATLLDLHRRKVITIREKKAGEGITVTVNQQASTDPYEQRVLDFLADVGKEGTVDSDEIKELADLARKDRTAEKRIVRYQRELARVTRKSDVRLVATYIVDGRDHILPLLLVAVAFCIVSVMAVIMFTALGWLLIPAVILWGGMLVQSAVAIVFPSSLFGHWRDDRYKEKLEWDAFARFLSDLAMIRKYSPADISMWGEWLVFGTALGVGEKVEMAMQELNISIPEAGVPLAVGLRTAFIPVMSFSPPSSGGGGGMGGGSFGGGGGFGGGGAGGR